jgi:hypothetical protein
LEDQKAKSGADIGKIKGWVEVIVRDKNGRIKYHYSSLEKPEEDCITNIGLACEIRLIFSGLTEDKFGCLAIGTGITGESPEDKALVSEVKRKTATIIQTTTNVLDDTALCMAVFSLADGLSGQMNISESGIFNAPSNGDLLARKVFDPVPVNWDVGETFTIQYYIQMSR